MRTNPEARTFHDRIEAGTALAARLEAYRHRPDVLVLGLPRGGVPVAARVAAALGAPLDVWLVRKLGVPGHEEYAMGAIASGGVMDLDEDLVQRLGISEEQVNSVVRRETRELARREREYRRDRPSPRIRGRTVILVDDGLATGSTMRAAVHALRKQLPGFVVAAVPVASNEACLDLARVADECVCLRRPEPFRAVGEWYRDFRPTTDAEVVACLERFGEGEAGPGEAARERTGS